MRIAGGICFTLYVIIAIAGAHAFGMGVDKNVLVSLSSARGLHLVPTALVATVFSAMSLVMICTFPLNAYGLRVGIHELVLGGQETPAQRWLGSAMLVLISLIVALPVDDLGALFRLTGATTGVYIMFLLPSSLLIRLALHPELIPKPKTYQPPSRICKPAEPSLPYAKAQTSQAVIAAHPPSAKITNIASAVGLLSAGVIIGGCGTASIFIR